jgi:uncharacterized protein
MDPLPIIYPIAGGLLIGIAAAILLILSGRVAGVSGMAAAAVRIADRGPPWRQAIAFVVGVPLGAFLISTFYRAPDIQITSSLPLLIIAGLLVGFGTRLGNGCTSGHGVCGLARLSPRSFAATATFMVAGFLVVFVARHVVGG